MIHLIEAFNSILPLLFMILLSAQPAGTASLWNSSEAMAAEGNTFGTIPGILPESEPGAKSSTAYPKGSMLAVKTLAGNIRRDPSPEAEVIEILYRGDLVSLIDRQGEWLAVRLHDGKTGWAHRSLLSASRPDVLRAGESEWVLKKIRIVFYSKNEERVLIDLSGFSSPDAFTIPGNSPAVVCDFPRTRCIDGLSLPEPQMDGFIRQVAVRRNGSSARVVVFLSGSYEYDAEQIFFSAENIYALIFKKR